MPPTLGPAVLQCSVELFGERQAGKRPLAIKIRLKLCSKFAYQFNLPCDDFVSGFLRCSKRQLNVCDAFAAHPVATFVDSAQQNQLFWRESGRESATQQPYDKQQAIQTCLRPLQCECL